MTMLWTQLELPFGERVISNGTVQGQELATSSLRQEKNEDGRHSRSAGETVQHNDNTPDDL